MAVSASKVDSYHNFRRVILEGHGLPQRRGQLTGVVSRHCGEPPARGGPGTPWGEHRSRYRFAARFTPGKRVLDVASGAGFGLQMLRQSGACPIGKAIVLRSSFLSAVPS